MTNQQTNLTLDDDDDAGVSGFREMDGETTSYTFRELLDAIASSESKELILTIPSEELTALKQGLTNRKAKDNQKMKDANIPVGTDTLTFLVYNAKDEVGDTIWGQMCVHVKLRPRRGVTILKMNAPDDTL